MFLALKTDGDVRGARPPCWRTASAPSRSWSAGRSCVMTQFAHGAVRDRVTALLAALALRRRRRAGRAAAARAGPSLPGAAILLLAVVTLFGDLWPNVLPSTDE